MNLLEKALIIRDIKNNIQIIEDHHLPLFERAKATHRLKEIFQFCEKPIIQKRYQGLSQFYTPQQISSEVLNKSDFQKSYRGLFHDQSLLLRALNENPLLGWGILYAAAEKKWQIWLIPQAKKGVIHSSWKEQLDDAYQWLLQQQNLLHCLIEDSEFPLDTVDETSTFQSATDLHSQPQASVVQPQTPQTITLTPQQVGIQVLIENTIKLELETWHADLTPIQVPTFTNTSYLVKFDELTPLDNLFLYLSVSHDSHEILNAPVIVAERINDQQQFMGYVVIFAAINPHIAIQLASQYCYAYQHQLAAIKSLSWQNWQDHAADLENFFENFHQQQVLWHPPEQIPFIPHELILTQRFIPFEEADADAQTPLILMKERQKYRVIHGENRLQFDADALGSPCILFSRQDGLSWQIIRELLDQLETPISANTLHLSIKQYLAQH